MITLFCSLSFFQVAAQDPQREWTEGGELENVEIEIVKEREITLPPANRNFEKVPPRSPLSLRSPTTLNHLVFRRPN